VGELRVWRIDLEEAGRGRPASGDPAGGRAKTD